MSETTTLYVDNKACEYCISLLVDNDEESGEEIIIVHKFVFKGAKTDRVLLSKEQAIACAEAILEHCRED